MDDFVVVQMNQETFETWVKYGITLIAREDIRVPSALVPGTSATGGQLDNRPFLVGLPGKYARALSRCESVWALLDEVFAISLPTESRTDEWRIRMENLGETWIPFAFQPEWAQIIPNGTPRCEGQEEPTTEESSGHITGIAVLETTLGMPVPSGTHDAGSTEVMSSDSDARELSRPPDAHHAEGTAEVQQLPLLGETSPETSETDASAELPRPEPRSRTRTKAGSTGKRRTASRRTK